MRIGLLAILLQDPTELRVRVQRLLITLAPAQQFHQRTQNILIARMRGPIRTQEYQCFLFARSALALGEEARQGQHALPPQPGNPLAPGLGPLAACLTGQILSPFGQLIRSLPEGQGIIPKTLHAHRLLHLPGQRLRIDPNERLARELIAAPTHGAGVDHHLPAQGRSSSLCVNREPGPLDTGPKPGVNWLKGLSNVLGKGSGLHTAFYFRKPAHDIFSVVPPSALLFPLTRGYSIRSQTSSGTWSWPLR